jgi:hypothetical protein
MASLVCLQYFIQPKKAARLGAQEKSTTVSVWVKGANHPWSWNPGFANDLTMNQLNRGCLKASTITLSQHPL